MYQKEIDWGRSSRGPHRNFDCVATSLQTSNFSCAEPNALITIVHHENELSPTSESTVELVSFGPTEISI